MAFEILLLDGLDRNTFFGSIPAILCLRLFAGFQLRVDADGLVKGRDGPADDEAESGAVAQVERAGFDIAALTGKERAANGGGGAGPDAERLILGDFFERRRKVVYQGAVEDKCGLVADAELDLDWSAERGGGEPGAAQIEGSGRG